MINRSILLLIVLIFVVVPAQSPKIDSFKALLKGEMNHERVDIFYDLLYVLIEVDYVRYYNMHWRARTYPPSRMKVYGG